MGRRFTPEPDAEIFIVVPRVKSLDEYDKSDVLDDCIPIMVQLPGAVDVTLTTNVRSFAVTDAPESRFMPIKSTLFDEDNLKVRSSIRVLLLRVINVVAVAAFKYCIIVVWVLSSRKLIPCGIINVSL